MVRNFELLKKGVPAKTASPIYFEASGAGTLTLLHLRQPAMSRWSPGDRILALSFESRRRLGLFPSGVFAEKVCEVPVHRPDGGDDRDP